MKNLSSLLFALVLWAPTALTHADTLTFGVVPQQSAKTLAAKWGPIFAHLSKVSGHTITFATAKDIPTFENRLTKGEYDFAYMNPYHYTVFSQKPGYISFAKQKDKFIQGIIVAHRNSSIQQLSDLKGANLAFPSPAAFAASVLPRAQLELDKIPFTPHYVSSHDSVYLSVSKGFFVAGGGVYRTFNNTNESVNRELKVLWETPKYTPHAFAAHPSVKKEVVQDVLDALLTMNSSEEGKALFKSINFKGIEPASNSDWDDIRALEITLLDHLLE
ncbi:phosphate/phosphite/phosphonate ABC transporter substrate-binding protein [Vibrio sp. SCSIO 43136]|uniref:phosphate/phosphite/phosphonate ABC transporter substrate-binding protein n=1 Tax=Vibrio sp. SCSIO 43136 TaxID=2819101 RepID=UPI00207506ED|nr:phosphate/phosphite/phosphonate ABC transporter substrate-binding protein [Vibrio sp. SCSIO 43136]USD66782.1 phosphate/phosphite/phosphonate ABC transporter substrate-binding protein [Vibrio sp. SCSIO 43136]